MGTTLTGTTPQDTYDSLIKVTDNGPLTGSLKKLTDGLGNDSSLSLSTAAASLSGTLAVTSTTTSAGLILSTNDAVLATDGSITKHSTVGLTLKAVAGAVFNFSVYSEDDNALIVNPTGTNNIGFVSGNVGIGTSAPSTKLTVDNSALGTTRAIDLVGNTSTAKGHLGYFADGVYLSSNYFFDGAQNNDVSGLGQSAIVLQASAGSASNIAFRTSAAGSTATTVRATIDADGLKFNGDTLQVNALDDYEEGTFTPTIAGSTTAGTASYISQVGVYTKIGRIVKFSITVNYNSGTGTGNLTISGLPFTSLAAGANSAASIGAFGDVALSASHIATAIVPNNSIIIAFEQYPTGGGSSIGVPYDAAGVILISGTYEV